MPNYKSKLFEGVQSKNVNKSFFDLSHEWKHDIDPGYYVPCLRLQTMPGDEFEIDAEFFYKMEPLYFPLIHKMMMDVDIFFVPNRIMWPAVLDPFTDGWTNWIMLNNSSDHPTVDVDMRLYESTTLNNSVMGYMGIPYLTFESGVRTTTITGLNAFAPMAYLMIWDEHYRIPELEAARSFALTSGDNTTDMQVAFAVSPAATNIRFDCLPAKWMKDYFTSGTPTPQVGNMVQIPVVGDTTNNVGGYPTQWIDANGNPVAVSEGLVTTGGTGNTISATTVTPVGLKIDASVRQLRVAEVLQSFKERLMKIGRRYRDYVKGMFAIDPTPMDVSVPVMIGNYKGSVQISEVFTQANTTLGESNFITGDYTGNAGLYEQANRTIRYQCREHGLLIAIMNVTPNTGYGQGIDRWWRYSTPYDYPMDIFSTVGDQEILKEEVMYNNVTAQLSKNQETFAYIPKFSEARWENNKYGTNLLHNAGLSVHLGKYYDPLTYEGSLYDSNIVINERFLRADSVTDGGTRVADTFRSLTFPTGQSSMKVIYAYVYWKIGVNRALPLYSTPGTGV